MENEAFWPDWPTARPRESRGNDVTSRGLAQNFVRIVFSPGILFARRSSCFMEFLFLESESAVVFSADILGGYLLQNLQHVSASSAFPVK